MKIHINTIKALHMAAEECFLHNQFACLAIADAVFIYEGCSYAEASDIADVFYGTFKVPEDTATENAIFSFEDGMKLPLAREEDQVERRTLAVCLFAAMIESGDIK